MLRTAEALQSISPPSSALQPALHQTSPPGCYSETANSTGSKEKYNLFQICHSYGLDSNEYHPPVVQARKLSFYLISSLRITLHLLSLSIHSQVLLVLMAEHLCHVSPPLRPHSCSPVTFLSCHWPPCRGMALVSSVEWILSPFCSWTQCGLFFLPLMQILSDHSLLKSVQGPPIALRITSKLLKWYTSPPGPCLILEWKLSPLLHPTEQRSPTKFLAVPIRKLFSLTSNACSFFCLKWAFHTFLHFNFYII